MAAGALGATQEGEEDRQRTLRDSFKFSRTTFEADGADMGLDINDPHFWDKLMEVVAYARHAPPTPSLLVMHGTRPLLVL